MTTLREKLLERQRESRSSREWKTFYVPGDVQEVLSLDEIRTCISRLSTSDSNPRDEHRFSVLIKETALFIFATLLLTGHEHHVFDFLYRRETDTRLTYTVDGLYFLPPVVAREFVNRQWELCPVLLNKQEIHRELRPREVLPFLEDEQTGEGGFATVYKVRLNRNCQNLVLMDGPLPSGRLAQVMQLTDTHDVLIARKELRERHKGFRERGILDMLQTLRHPNIIQFLGSYSQYGTENLLFPYISTDLAQLLRSERQMDSHDVHFGMYGIADALSKIHEFTFSDGSVEFTQIGCHHDFRPENILVHGTTFLISDFGLSSLRPDNRDSKSRLKGGHDNYLGPESFDSVNWENGSVGRALDIWSFGCMLAEVATFVEGSSVEEFELKRKATYGGDIAVTDCAFHLGGKLRPAVNEWLAALNSHATDSQLLSIVELVFEMLNPNLYKRIKIATVTERLAFIALKSRIQAIKDLFESMLPVLKSNISGTSVQVFLEHKRFESWASVFNGLHKGDQILNVAAISERLASLLAVLALAKTELANPSCTGSQEGRGVLGAVQIAVDSLCADLPSVEARKMRDSWTRAVCEVQDTGVLLAVQSIGNLDRYRHVGASAAMRYMSRIISTSISTGTRSRYIDPGCVDIDEGLPTESYDMSNAMLIEDKTRVMGYMDEGSGGKRVMIEWKEYDNRWQGEQGSKLFKTMDALVNLLDPSVTPLVDTMRERVLVCRGYFHEPRNYRFGFVYSLKPSAAQDAQLFSINNVIRMTDPELTGSGNVERPDLGDIFALAKDLARCLYTFHNADWIHKTVTSHHLLLFLPSTQLVHRHVGSAILAGFNDSRREASGYTLGPRTEFAHYQHPAYGSNTEFKQSFDYFGLGIVLLELGLWLPVSTLRSDHSDIASAEGFRKKLIMSYVPQLGERMGAVYRDAVEFCLDAEHVLQSGEESGSVALDVRSLFASRVVEPLSQCFA